MKLARMYFGRRRGDLRTLLRRRMVWANIFVSRLIDEILREAQ